MNNLFKISTDSGCDLELELLQKRNIFPAMMAYTIDNEEKFDTLKKEDSIVLFNKMRNGSLPHTAALNPSQLVEFWEKCFEKDDLPLIHLCLGSGISSTYRNCELAVEMFNEDHPDKKVFAIDTLGASGSYGLMALKLAELRDQGASVEEALKWIEDNKLKINAYYTTGELKWFYEGGRISKTSFAIAKALNLWPILTVNKEGRLAGAEKVRGKAQTYEKIVKIIKERVENPKDQTLIICHTDNEKEALEMKDRIVKECGFKDAIVSYMGSTIGSHTGPDLLTFFFIGKERD